MLFLIVKSRTVRELNALDYFSALAAPCLASPRLDSSWTWTWTRQLRHIVSSSASVWFARFRPNCSAGFRFCSLCCGNTLLVCGLMGHFTVILCTSLSLSLSFSLLFMFWLLVVSRRGAKNNWTIERADNWPLELGEVNWTSVLLVPSVLVSISSCSLSSWC